MLDRVSLDQLRTFIAAADEGSFSAAGRRLLRAQSVVSDILAKLKGQLGVKLFDRTTRFPGRRFSAEVTSVSPSTGSQFSLLPPENATGNWVKVVQRVPVRLQLTDVDAGFLLQVGLSADVTVDTYSRDLELAAATGPAAAGVVSR
jgi:TolB-like protein